MTHAVIFLGIYAYIINFNTCKYTLIFRLVSCFEETYFTLLVYLQQNSRFFWKSDKLTQKCHYQFKSGSTIEFSNSFVLIFRNGWAETF